MEADPGTFDAERLRESHSPGRLTQFSVDVQTFQEARADPAEKHQR